MEGVIYTALEIETSPTPQDDLLKNNYQLCLTKNIRSVLLLPNLKNLFKKRLELEFQWEIVNIELKIGNIHHSSHIRFNSRSLLEKFIPQLQEKFKIDECLVTQEQNTPMQTNPHANYAS